MTCEALFNSYCFLFAFLPLTLVGYWLVPVQRWKVMWLATASLVFYSFWDVRFVALLVGSALGDFLLAIGMSRSPRKRAWLVASLALNLGVLFVFKYAVFAADSARSLFDVLGVPIELPYFSILLPIGISFYTFESMSYTIDVYRGEVPATRDFAKYLAFVSLFPHLVAGPIVRYRQLSDQLDALPSRLVSDAIVRGLALFATGLFMKVAIADSLAREIDPLWARASGLTAGAAWAAAAGYALQLYFDFAGYSTMAIGLGALLGLAIPVNFRAPYQALNPVDFWRRWHISLSTFLRDYLYFPLGGNRRGEGRAAMNVMIVMTLGGLWHGASWTFVAWGLAHGLAILTYRATRPWWDGAPVVVQRALTLLLVVAAWVLFRAPDFSTAGIIYAGMVGAGGNTIGAPALLIVSIGALCVFVTLARPAVDREWAVRKRTVVAAGALVGIAVILMRAGSSPFLYYQF